MIETVEYVVALVFAALGIRSVVHWARRPFETNDVRDLVLYALYLTGRVGLWFAVAGLFVLYGSTRTRGRAFTDDVATYRWYAVVFLALAALQLVAGQFLGRRSPD